MKFVWMVIIFLNVLLLACSRSLVTECDNPDEGNSNMITETVTFTQIQNQILTPSCARARCHVGNFPTAGLDLSAGAWDRLVNIPSTEKPELLLVKPGDSNNSFLVHKLTANNTNVMPPGNPLDQTLIDSVKSWIDSGALNN